MVAAGTSGVRAGLPSTTERLDRLQVCIETLRALWAPGTKAHHGRYVHLPETTCYPRPVGRCRSSSVARASGERYGSSPSRPTAATCPPIPPCCGARSRCCTRTAPSWTRPRRGGDHRSRPAGDRHRPGGHRRPGRTTPWPTPAAAFAARTHAGLAADHARRYLELTELGVGTVFVSLPDLRDAADLLRCAPLLAGLRVWASGAGE